MNDDERRWAKQALAFWSEQIWQGNPLAAEAVLALKARLGIPVPGISLEGCTITVYDLSDLYPEKPAERTN